VDEQRVPDLEELDEHQVRHFLAELFSELSAEAEYDARHEDYVMEMPQSGERIRGREKMRQLQQEYPAPPPFSYEGSPERACGSSRESTITVRDRFLASC
jgi:hypothetical protein